MDNAKISKNTREVLLLLSDGSLVQGEVFLSLYEAHHSGPQRVGDLLKQEPAFIPVKTAEGTRLINIQQIMMAKIRAEWERDELFTLGEKYKIRILTLDHQEIEADVFVNMPNGFCRVKDYLNQSLRFYTFFVPFYVLYINPSFILSIQD